MILQILLVNLGLLFVFMSAAFLVAKARKRIDTVDLCWGLGFVLVGWSTMSQQPTGRSLIVALLITIWGLRLATHIFKRHKGKGDDPRYKQITGKWQGNIWPRAYISIFLLQGALVWLVSLPVVVITNPELQGRQWLIILGIIIWLKGFVIEAIADRQLKNFLSRKDRPKVMQTGLWRYSRHPNYFGELLQWWGIGVMALAASYGWIGLFGPALLSYLIIFVSGIPPIERRRLKDAEYLAYKKRTSSLILLPPRNKAQQ